MRLVAALRRHVGGEDAEFDCSTHAVQFTFATQAAQHSSGLEAVASLAINVVLTLMKRLTNGLVSACAHAQYPFPFAVSLHFPFPFE